MAMRPGVHSSELPRGYGDAATWMRGPSCSATASTASRRVDHFPSVAMLDERSSTNQSVGGGSANGSSAQSHTAAEAGRPQVSRADASGEAMAGAPASTRALPCSGAKASPPPQAPSSTSPEHVNAVIRRMIVQHTAPCQRSQIWPCFPA